MIQFGHLRSDFDTNYIHFFLLQQCFISFDMFINELNKFNQIILQRNYHCNLKPYANIYAEFMPHG
jgi:hypothetical protein